MLEQSERANRTQAAQRCFCCQQGKSARRRGRERIARGIVRLDFPSREAGEHAARKGAIAALESALAKEED